MPTLSELNVKIGANIAGLQRGLRQAERSLMRSSRNLGRVGDLINKNISAPFLAASGYGVKLAFDLQQNFSKIENLVGVTGDRLDMMKESVKSISNEVGQGQVKLSQALFTVTSAGLRGAEAVDVLRASAKASSIGLGETEEVARATTAVIQAYGKENITAARAVNVLTSIVREGNVEASSLAPTLGKIIGTASLMGISFEEVGANIATFTRLGVSAEQAVDGLQAIMTSMLKPSKEAEKILSDFGLSAEALRKSIKENGLAQTLIFLTEKFKGNEASLAKVVGEVQSFRTIMGTAGVQGEEYIRILDGIENQTSDVDEAFKNVSRESSQKFKVALEQLKNSAVDLGVEMLPTVNRLIDSVGKFTRKLQDLDPETKTMLVNFGKIAVIGGGSLMVLSKMASGLGAIAMVGRSAIKILGGIRVALAGLGVSNPFLIMATTVGLLVSKLPALKRQIDEVGEAAARAAVSGGASPLITDTKIQKKSLPGKVGAGALGDFGGKDSDAHKFVSGIGVVANKTEKDIDSLVNSMEDLFNSTAKSNKETSKMADLFKQLQKDLFDAEQKSLVFMDTFQVGSEKMDIYQKAISELIEMGMSPYHIVVQNLKAAMDQLAQSTTAQIEPLALFREATEAAKNKIFETNEEVVRSNDNIQAWVTKSQEGGTELAGVGDVMNSALADVSGNLINAATSGEDAFDSLRRAAIDSAKALIRVGLAALLESVFTTIPFPASLLVAGGAIAAGAALTALLPKAAKGAVVSGPTAIMVGDNPNASVDPEVISPLSKLKQLISGEGQTINITGHLVGRADQLIGVIDTGYSTRRGLRGF